MILLLLWPCLRSCVWMLAVYPGLYVLFVVSRITTEINLNIQSVPRSKHSLSVIKTNQLMLYREIIAVCSEIHTRHINTRCGQNVEFVNFKRGVTYSNHWTLEGELSLIWVLFSRVCFDFYQLPLLVIIQILFCSHDPPPRVVCYSPNDHVSKFSVVCTVTTLL